MDPYESRQDANVVMSEEIVTATEMEAKEPHMNQGFEDNIVPWNNPETGKKHHIPTRWYWGSIVKRMITHNKAHGFTGIVLIGMSGSGKTTLTQTIIHMLHEYGENYVVDWFNGHDMLNIDKKINAMTVGVPHIMVFDDASYTMENAKAAEVGKLANALTTVRHKVKSKVIMVMNIHYSKATKKFFRNQHFTFLTSVTTEELGNLKDLFQDKMPVIRQFGSKYRQMALLGHFYAPINFYKNQYAKYKINDPFRLGLVSEITDTHFFLYPRLSCPKCVPGGKVVKVLKTKEIVDKLMGYKNLSSLKVVLRFWMAINNENGERAQNLPYRYRSWWNMLEKTSKAYKVDWTEVSNMLEDATVKSQKKFKIRSKRKAAMSLADVVRAQADEQKNRQNDEAFQDSKIKEIGHSGQEPDENMFVEEPDEDIKEATDEPITTPDYDSTYIPPPS